MEKISWKRPKAF